MANDGREKLRSAIRGPVCPILTPFKEDSFAVDDQALHHYVDFLATAGVPVVMSTVGTSRFNLLSNDEMMAMNRTLVDAAAGRCVTIVAGPMTGDLSLNIEFARHAESIGADAFIAFYPERYYGEEPIYAFFKTISESVDIGVMIHEMPMRSGYGGTAQYSLDLLDRLTDLPGIVGLKEECMDPGYTYRVLRRVADKCGVIGAGSMRNYLRDCHAGAKAYLVGIGSFFPCVAIAFYEAVASGDFDKAHAIVRRYEDPFFDRAVGLGWHVALKELLHLFDLMPATERPPLTRLNPDQRAELDALVDGLGWRALAPDHLPQSV